jgi:hypothetical protein
VGESAGTGCGVEQSLVVGHKKVRLRRMSRAVPRWIAARDRAFTGRTVWAMNADVRADVDHVNLVQDGMQERPSSA